MVPRVDAGVNDETFRRLDAAMHDVAMRVAHAGLLRRARDDFVRETT